MSGNQIQPVNGRDAAVDSYDAAAPAEWGGGQDAPPPPKGPKLGRYLAAVNRFKWLIVLFALIGAVGGYAATKFISPAYEVSANIILEMQTGAGSGNDRGPIQAPELLRAAGWQDLLRSYAIADPVVIDLGLFVDPADAADSTLFRSFRVNQGRLRPGTYLLAIQGQQYTLSLQPGAMLERGNLSDSIGRSVGFQWQPGVQAFAGKKEVEFSVQTPREASRGLIRRLGMSITEGSPYLSLSFTDDNPQQAAKTLNAWVERFVTVATALKKKSVTEYAVILEGQRDYAAGALSDAEAALSSFRTSVVTLPNERQTLAPGIDITTNPVIEGFFNQKSLAASIQRDRETLERVFAQGRQSGSIQMEAVFSVPSVNSDPAAENLRSALKEQSEREVKLRQAREIATDELPVVKNALAALNTVRTVTVPSAMEAYLQQLRLREQQLKSIIAAGSRDLQGIPARTIEEKRREREVEVSAQMYQSLDLKAQEAKLAEAATIPDVSVLDSAVAPLKPTRNTAPVIILGAIGAALGLAIVLAILLDQTDKRFRYPEQATDDLGLFVLGVVPNVENKSRRRAADQAAQVVEAFRSIRMNVRYAADPGRPLMMTITSPGPNDGKSLIASNLALSFAEAGSHTLLIDGDIRRGELATTFGTPQRPGLVEYLDGTALIAEVLHPATSHPNLTLMPAGARRRRAPELLATPRLNQLLNQMASEYDVVIVDSPPLGAGFDAYALSTATGNMALVMRAGVTDRKMAAAKMAIVDTLPVRVMGTILNGIKLTGVYQYYSYYQDYAAHDEEPPVRMVESGGRSNVPAVVSED
jgi:succinoglycan biosynthesis transport protein ExoP